MKITKKQLRKLIEGIFIDDPGGPLLSPKDVDDFDSSGKDKDDEALGIHSKLDPLLKSTHLPTKKQGRSLAVTLGYQDDLTPYEELAVDHIDDSLIQSPDTPIEHPPLLNRKAHRIQLELTKEFEQFLNSPKGAELARTIVEKYIKSFPNRLPHPEEIGWISYLLVSNSPKYAGFNLKSRIYRKLGLDADDGYIVDPQTRAMFQELNHHLLLKLRAIAIKRFDTNYIKVVKGQMGGEKFPLALTEAELRKLIAEALDEGSRIIVDPEGEATVASDAYPTGAAKDAQTTHPKLMTLRQSGVAGQRQARDLAVALDMQPELTTAEETAVEMGQQKAMAPDLKFHNELPGTKSIELSKYIKRECQKRGFVCSVKDLRHKGYISSGQNYTPFIKMFIEGVHPLRQKTINAEVFIEDSWTGSVDIQMRAYHQDGTARSGVLTNRNTAPYLSGASGYGGIEALAELVIDAVLEL
jgi:hypothetical protein